MEPQHRATATRGHCINVGRFRDKSGNAPPPWWRAAQTGRVRGPTFAAFNDSPPRQLATDSIGQPNRRQRDAAKATPPKPRMPSATPRPRAQMPSNRCLQIAAQQIRGKPPRHVRPLALGFEFFAPDPLLADATKASPSCRENRRRSSSVLGSVPGAQRLLVCSCGAVRP